MSGAARSVTRRPTAEVKIEAANRRRRLVTIAVTIVFVGHWMEHVVQAMQIYALGWHPSRALGFLGLLVPLLVTSEWLHWVYNLALVGGIALVRPRFTGPARPWVTAALWAQGWHFLEHSILLVQVLTHVRPFGGVPPRSIVQLIVPRVELHLVYNTLVTALVLAAVLLTVVGTSRPAIGARSNGALSDAA